MLEELNAIKKKELLSLKDRICFSKEFKTKRRLCELFNYLIDKTINGNEEDFKGYTIGTEILNRPDDFNPDNDPIVRIHIGRLRRSLELYYLKEGKNDDLRISIPLGANIPSFETNQSSSFINSSKADKEIESGIVTQTTIAVIPFKNLSGDTKKEYLATGFTEDLIIELSRYEDFRVLVFSREWQSSAQLSDKIQADFIIQGSIRINNETIKTNIDLIDTVKQEHIWGDHFKHKLSSVSYVNLQENISTKVTRVIAGEYGIILQKLSERSYSKSISDSRTYDAILRFYHYEYTLSPESAQDALKALEDALSRDPSCGIIYSMIASIYGIGYLLDLPGTETLLPLITSHAQKGIELMPNGQATRIVYAWTFFLQNKKSLFLSNIENALALNPKSPLRIGNVGYFLALYGEWDKGISLLKQSMELNIGFPKWYHGVIILDFYRKSQYSEAYKECLKYDIANLFWVPLLKTACLGKLQRIEEAKGHINHLLALRPDFLEKSKDIIGRYIKDRKLIVDVFDGLEMAGLVFKKSADN